MDNYVAMPYKEKIAKLCETGMISEEERAELEKEAEATHEMAKLAVDWGKVWKWLGDRKMEAAVAASTLPIIVSGGEMAKHYIDKKRMYNKMLKEYPNLKQQYSDRELRKAYNIVADYMPNLLKNDAVLAGAVRQIVQQGVEQGGVPPAAVSSLVSDARMVGSGSDFYKRDVGQEVQKMLGKSVQMASYPVEMQASEVKSQYDALKGRLNVLEERLKNFDDAIANLSKAKTQEAKQNVDILMNQRQALQDEYDKIKEMVDEMNLSGVAPMSEAQIQIAKGMREFGGAMAEGGGAPGLFGFKRNAGSGMGSGR